MSPLFTVQSRAHRLAKTAFWCCLFLFNTAAGQAPQNAPSRKKPDPPTFEAGKLERRFFLNVLDDQKDIYTVPAKVRWQHLKWLIPAGAVTGGLIAKDADLSRDFSMRPSRTDAAVKFSDAGLAFQGALVAGLYIHGRMAKSDRSRETGVLAAQAVADAMLFNLPVKFVARRELPTEGFGRGRFFQSNSASFMSDHAIASWAAASVVAHEYPGILTKIGVYGLASAVSVARVPGRKHFPTDVVLGSAVGYFIGRHVYRKYHDPNLGGDNIGTFVSDSTPSVVFERTASVYVPVEHWSYDAMDRLIGMGYVNTAIVGVRPWTRKEMVRLLEEARRADEERALPEGHALVSRLSQEFERELKLLNEGTGVRSVTLEEVYSRTDFFGSVPLTDSFHFGQSRVNDYGRPLGKGISNVTGFGAFAIDGRTSVYFRGEFQHAGTTPFALPLRQSIASTDNLPVQPAGNGEDINRFRVLEAYVSLELGNINLSFGKQSLWWGPNRGGSMLFSNNSEPIYMMRASTIHPFQMPGFLSKLGPARSEFFFGRISGHGFPPRPFLHGQKLSFKPTKNLELGFTRTVVMGGTGRPLTTRSFVRSMFSLTSDLNIPGQEPGDRRSGFDFSYRLPKLRDWVTIYSDSFVDDDVSPLAAPRRGPISPGIYFAKIPKLPRLDLRVESAFSDLRLNSSIGGQFNYVNVRYPEGYTNNGQIIGHWIGREALGFLAMASYRVSGDRMISASFRTQQTRNDFIPGGGHLTDVSVRGKFSFGSVAVDSRVGIERRNIPLLGPVETSPNVSVRFSLKSFSLTRRGR